MTILTASIEFAGQNGIGEHCLILRDPTKHNQENQGLVYAYTRGSLRDPNQRLTEQQRREYLSMFPQ